MRAIEVLGQEHQLLVAMMTVLDGVAARLAAGGDVPADLVADLVAAFQFHVDENHVVKEEQVLFPALEAHGVERDTAVVAALTAQHEAGRVFRRDLAALCARMVEGDEAARRAFPALAREYIELLREHLRIEDEYFYSLADGTIQSDADERLYDLFAKVDDISGAPARTHETRRVVGRCRAVLGI
jgi:hemerythrin-like domain-containing protein